MGRRQNALQEVKVDIELLELQSELAMSDEELEGLVSQLTRLPSALPNEAFVDQVLIEWGKSSLLAPEDTAVDAGSYASLSLAQGARIVLSHIDVSFLIYGLVFYLAGLLWLNNNTAAPTEFILPIIAGIPFLAAVLGMARMFDQGVLELMMSLRLKLVWYLNARFLVMGVYSLLVNLVFSVVLADGGVSWVRLILYWSIPSVLTSAIALWLCTWVRDFGVLLTSFVALPVASLMFFGERSVQEWLIGVSSMQLLVVLAFAVMLLGLASLAASRHVQSGGMIVGTRA